MKTRAQDIAQACAVMRAGGVILYPTDTIWGIGCDPTNPDAVRKVYEIKHRADNKALILLTDSMAIVEAYVDEIPDIAWDLVELSTRPLTIIYSGARNLAPELLGEDGSVGIRVTQEPFSQALCRSFRKPIVSTSANVSGDKAPANFSEISPEIIAAVDYVVESRRDEETRCRPSGIIKVGKGGLIKVIRE